MATYVMSDLHGMYNSMINMLKLIKFTAEDELIICGDILDRGQKPIDILEYIVAHDNIHLIRGNHEEMFLEWYNYGDYYYVSKNGGYTTIEQVQQYQMKSNINYTEAISQYISRLPLYKILEINQKKYILIHAGLDIPVHVENMNIQELIAIQDKNTILWDTKCAKENKIFKDYTIIHGHIPVQLIEEGNPGNIIKREGNIFIDCGACFNDGRLACLRLDDMKEFYV